MPFIITDYAPSVGRQHSDHIASLSALLGTLRKDHWTVLMGDFNGQIGKDAVTPPPDVIGQAAKLLHEETNVAGSCVVTMARLHQLPIMTTSNRAKECLVTWRRGRLESQLDHVMSDYPSVRRVNGAFVDEQVFASDHALIVPPPPRFCFLHPGNQSEQRLAAPATQLKCHHQKAVSGSHCHLPDRLRELPARATPHLAAARRCPAISS